MTHTNDSCRSPPNSGFTCRNTQFNMFHSYKWIIFIKTGILNESLSQITLILILISRKILILDNLFVFCVQGDHTAHRSQNERGHVFSWIQTIPCGLHDEDQILVNWLWRQIFTTILDHGSEFTPGVRHHFLIFLNSELLTRFFFHTQFSYVIHRNIGCVYWM